MALYPVDVKVHFLDSAERTAIVTYRLAQQYDDSLGGNFSIVFTAASELATDLMALTMAEVTNFEICIIFNASDTPANVAANNQVRAFTRTHDSGGNKSSFEVPAWDDVIFDQNYQNMLSGAYNVAAATVMNALANPDTGLAMTTLDYSQSRTRKSRNIVND